MAYINRCDSFVLAGDAAPVYMKHSAIPHRMVKGPVEMLNWLLIFVPAAVLLEYIAPAEHVWIFVTSGLAILPLAVYALDRCFQLITHKRLFAGERIEAQPRRFLVGASEMHCSSSVDLPLSSPG